MHNPSRFAFDSSCRGKVIWGHIARRLIAAALFVLPAVPASAQIYTLSWHANTDPLTIGYRVFAGTRSGDYQWNADVGNVTSVRIPDLNDPGTYYFAVRAYDHFGGMSNPSIEVTFDVGPPGQPPALTASAIGSRVALRWGSASGLVPATHYLLYVGTQPNTANIVSGFPVGNQLAVTGDLARGRYYVRVQAANRFGAGPLSSEVAVDVGPMEAPGSPEALSETWQGSVLTLSWNWALNATSYVVEAGSRPGAADLASIVAATNGLVVDVPPGTFYVRVRAVNAAGVSAPSREIVVRGPGAPMPPVGLSSTQNTTSVTLNWSPPASGPEPTGYLIEAGSQPGLADLAVLRLPAQTSYTAMAPPGTYYLRVRAMRGGAGSEASNEIAVTIRD
jgi:predicted phage tail protein